MTYQLPPCLIQHAVVHHRARLQGLSRRRRPRQLLTGGGSRCSRGGDAANWRARSSPPPLRGLGPWAGGISGGTVLPQGQNFLRASAHASITFWITTSGAKFLRAFSACECHLLEHYLRGNFFPAPSAQASITTTNIAQKVANIRVGDHSHIHSRQRCREEFLPTGLLRPGGDYHLVIAGKGEHHPVKT